MAAELPYLASLEPFELLDAPIWLLDMRRYRQVWANQAGLDLWGVSSQEELLARDLEEDMSPAVRDRLEKVRAMAEDGMVMRESVSLFPRGKPVRTQILVRGVRTPLAEYPLLLNQAQVVARGADEMSNRAFDALLWTPSAVSLFSKDGTQALWENQSSRMLFGERGALGPSLWSRFARSEDREELSEVLSESEFLSDARLLQTVWGPRWHLIDVRRMTDSSTAQPALLMLHTDIHQWKVAELELRDAKAAADKARLRAESASQARNAFLANMSHEIRTPLNGVLGTLQVMGDTPLDPEQCELLEAAQGSASALLGMLNSLLDSSLLESGELCLKSVPFEVTTMVAEAVRAHRAEAEAKGVSFDVEIPEDAVHVRGDPERLAQVLRNLVDNAVKFTERGQVRVQARMRVREGGGTVSLEITIRDTGCGLSEDELERIFVAFTQVDGSFTRLHGGAGLGLSLSRALLQLMGGSLGVESESGRGSCFTVRVDLESAPPAEDPEMLLASGSEKLRVLVVDDNPVNRRVILGMLRGLACTIVEAEDGLEAVHLFESGDFDVVLMDLQMPRLDGWDATLRIREIERERGRPGAVVIAVTANTLPEDKVRCREVGMDAFLAKPCRKQELLREMARGAV
ncbi:MAG: ATP-binding protein [Myxococcota bacterium]